MKLTPSLDFRDPARGLRLVAREAADDALVAHIESIRFGTGGLRYRYRQMGPKLRAIAHPIILELSHDDTLVGTYVLSRKRVVTPAGPTDAWYRGLLTVAEGEQGNGYGRLLVERAFAWFAARAAAQGRPLMTYGCIEGENTRSSALLESLGSRVVGAFRALPTYLHTPKPAVHVEPLNPGEAPAITAALRAQYTAYALHDIGARIDPARYLIAPGPHGPRAGASVHLEHLVLDDIGGALDPIVRTLVKAPIVRDRVDLDDLRWLELHDVYLRPGDEAIWPDFLAALLHHHRAHVAVFYLDPTGPTHATLRKAGVFDLVSKLFDTPITVSLAAFGPGRDALIEQIDGAPLCVYPAP